MPTNLTGLAAIETFLRQRLAAPLPGADAHLRFAPRPAHEAWRPDDRPVTARQAAALILLYPGEHGVTIPLTVRHDELPHHPGQISLPGGRVDFSESAESAALRETYEEIGVRTEAVRVLGALSSLWVIVSNHLVQPFIGATDTKPEFRLAAGEVEALVELPLASLHDITRIGRERRVRDGIDVDYPYFKLAGHQVWGATAMILGEFGALFEPDFGPGST